MRVMTWKDSGITVESGKLGHRRVPGQRRPHGNGGKPTLEASDLLVGEGLAGVSRSQSAQ